MFQLDRKYTIRESGVIWGRGFAVERLIEFHVSRILKNVAWITAHAPCGERRRCARVVGNSSTATITGRKGGGLGPKNCTKCEKMKNAEE